MSRLCLYLYCRAKYLSTLLFVLTDISNDMWPTALKRHIREREVLLHVFCAKHVVPDHAWVQGLWLDFEPHTWTMPNMSFQGVSKHAAFLCISGSFFPDLRSAYHPRYEAMDNPQKWTEKAARASWFCRPVTRLFLVNEQQTAKPSRPTNNVAWTTYVVRGRNTYHERNLSIIQKKTHLHLLHHQRECSTAARPCRLHIQSQRRECIGTCGTPSCCGCLRSLPISNWQRPRWTNRPYNRPRARC